MITNSVDIESSVTLGTYGLQFVLAKRTDPEKEAREQMILTMFIIKEKI